MNIDFVFTHDFIYLLCKLIKTLSEYKPVNHWSIDPFGLSPTISYFMKRSNFSNGVLQRVHYSVKKYLAQRKQLEFSWRQLWGLLLNFWICKALIYALLLRVFDGYYQANLSAFCLLIGMEPVINQLAAVIQKSPVKQILVNATSSFNLRRIILWTKH